MQRKKNDTSHSSFKPCGASTRRSEKCIISAADVRMHSRPSRPKGSDATGFSKNAPYLYLVNRVRKCKKIIKYFTMVAVA